MKPRDMIVIIDIGNTDSVIALYPRRKRSVDLRLPNSSVPAGNDLWPRIDKFLRASRVAPGAIEGTAISSVVPRLTNVFSRVLKSRLGITPVVIDGSMDIGIKIRYDDPLALGPDRICSAVAAFQHYGGPVIIVDCGTATTFDVVTAKGEFIGGAIAPGIRTAAEALAQRTARLPKVRLQFPRQVIARNTIEAMQSGILYSSLDGIGGMVSRFKSIAGKNAKVVLTGGFASLLASKSSFAHVVLPTLVLDGAYLIHQRLLDRTARRRS